MPDDPGAKKLDPSDKKDDACKRRPAGNRISPDQRTKNDHADHKKGENTKCNSHDRGKGKRRHGETGDPLQRITK